jgi:hypothetical protein
MEESVKLKGEKILAKPEVYLQFARWRVVIRTPAVHRSTSVYNNIEALPITWTL